MQAHLDENQRMLGDAVARYLQRNYDLQSRHDATRPAGKHSPAHWAAFADLGLLGLTIPESYGGMGFDATSTYVVMEAFGRHLVTEPYVSTAILCPQLLLHAPSDAAHEKLLSDVITGTRIVAFAHGEPQTDYTLHNVETRAVRDSGGWVLNGRKSVVIHGAIADMLLISARTSGTLLSPEGISLFLLDPCQPGVTRNEYASVDGMPCADFHFNGVRLEPAALLGLEGEGYPAILRATDIAAAALCAESVGAMSAIFDATLDYVKTRKQFGNTIGSFQAVQHRLVDMYLELEQARSLAWLAAMRVDSADDIERQRIVSAAKAKCSSSGRFIGQQGMQLHGGIGMTDELALGRHVKRLVAIEHTFGDARHHLARYARLAVTT
ncbi:acyl-CoA dehydrogenase family protein [Noviherbaspirillum saxi]|nr:acyl-CoA dehydrogenase family protein [Noviherbaspirillum saxi]